MEHNDKERRGLTEIGERRKKFYDALRSGKYEQGRHALRNQFDQYCCLGVACDIYNRNLWRSDSDDGWVYQMWRGTLPGEVTEYYGFPSGDPILLSELHNENMLTNHATGINDSGATFAEIADLFEARYPVE